MVSHSLTTITLLPCCDCPCQSDATCLKKAWQQRGHHQLPDHPLSTLCQAWAPQLEALLDNIGAELLLGQLRVVIVQLSHDGCCGLNMSQLQHILDYIVPKWVLQVMSACQPF